MSDAHGRPYVGECPDGLREYQALVWRELRQFCRVDVTTLAIPHRSDVILWNVWSSEGLLAQSPDELAATLEASTRIRAGLPVLPVENGLRADRIAQASLAREDVPDPRVGTCPPGLQDYWDTLFAEIESTYGFVETFAEVIPGRLDVVQWLVWDCTDDCAEPSPLLAQSPDELAAALEASTRIRARLPHLHLLDP